MQQPPSMVAMMPTFPPTNITTEQIQKYLDENKKLILAILDNQNLGKLAECAQYQAQLQKNLMYLAAIADAQPQAPSMSAQMPTHPLMQQGGHYMQQHPQAAMVQQAGMFPGKVPLQFNPQQMQDQQQQQLQHQNQMGMRMGGGSNGMHGMQSEGAHGGGPSSTAGLSEFARVSSGSLDVRGNKQDASEGGSSDGQGNSAGGHGGNDPSFLKGSDNGN